MASTPEISKQVERRREVRLRRSMLLDNPLDRAVTYKIATSRADHETAFQLVWRNYRDAGLQGDNPTDIRFTKYHLLPQSRVIVAHHYDELAKDRPDPAVLARGGQCVGTVSLVFDTPLGLPMEDICHEEIEALRRQGRSVAEAIGLAIEPEYRKYNILMYLYKFLFQFARLKGVTDLCCSVMLKHADFYQNMVLLERIGEPKVYAAGNDVLAQGMRLDIEQAQAEGARIYGGREFDADLHRFFFGEDYARPRGEGQAWGPNDVAYFVTERTRFLDTLGEQDLQLLRTEYERLGLVFPF